MKFETIFVTMLFMHIRAIEFYPLETHGLHFEKISTAYISHKNWNIIYSYDLRDLMVAVKTIKTNIMDIETFCKQDPKITCKSTVGKLKEPLQNIMINKYMIESTETNIENKITRIRRNLYLTNPIDNSKAKYEYLRTEPSQSSADIFLSRFTKTKSKNQNKPLHLLNKAITTYKNSIQETNKNVKTIKNELKNTIVTNKIMERKKSEIYTWVHKVKEIIKTLESVTTYIHKMLLNDPNTMNIELLTIEQLYSDIMNIKPQLKINEKLPFEPTRKIDILKYITIKTSLRNKILMIKITTPIIENTSKGTLYKIIPTPIIIDNTSKIIKTKTQFTITDKTYYTPITINEQKTCIQINDDLICKPTFPTYKNNLCELEILQKTRISSCTYENIPHRNHITPLNQNNVYHIHIVEPMDIKIICENTTQFTYTIIESGIIKTPKTCEIRTKDYEIKYTEDKNYYTTITHELKIKHQLDNTDEYTQKDIDTDSDSTSIKDLSELERGINEQISSGEDADQEINKNAVKLIMILTVIFLILYLNLKFHIIDIIKNRINQFAILNRRETEPRNTATN